jgi:perosamine synthetase
MIISHSRPFIDEDDIKAVYVVFASGKIAQGEVVRKFEDAIAGFVGVKYGVACSSGTSALHLCLLSLGVRAGDEVVMPSFVCSSPYFATLHAGAVPRIADINSVDFNINAESVGKQLTAKTKAIIVPHMFGTPSDLDELLELEVPIIEDCAQSLGADYKGKHVGSFGVLSAFSFYATKMITTGEGGMVLTNKGEFFEKVSDLRDYDKKLLSPTKYNSKMTDFQAALGLSQFKKLRYFIERRTQIAAVYNEAFSKYQVELPSSPSHKKSVHFRYVIKTYDRDRIRLEAREKGVTCERPVFQPLHDSLGLKNFPSSDEAKLRALSIPIYPALLKDEIDYIINTLGKALPLEY